jgi:uncharacterized protein YxeA
MIDMKKILLIIFVVVVVMIIGVKAYATHSRYIEWESDRVVQTITVRDGDTLDGIGYQYSHLG